MIKPSFVLKFNFSQNFYAISLIFAVLIGCTSMDEKEAAIEALDLNVTLDRFDLKFHNASPEVIFELKEKYPYLFPEQFDDHIWIQRQKDSLQLMLQAAVSEKFDDAATLNSTLTHLFKHIAYEFPAFKVPHTIGLINNVDYQSKTIYADSLLLVSLDTYLGASNPLYEGIPSYVRQQMDDRYLPAHVAEKIAETIVSPPQERSLLAAMLYHGKIFYLKKLFLPHTSDAILHGFTEDQEQWALGNETYIWQYFVENQILFDPNPALQDRFIAPAPFSKFYLEIDNESPGGIGRWLGAQMVMSFIEKNNPKSLNAWIELPAQTLFNKSNYKPKR